MDIYKATFWGSPKKPIVITEDHLIASITEPVVNTYVPQTIKISERNNLTVLKVKFLMEFYRLQLKLKSKFLIILLEKFTRV